MTLLMMMMMTLIISITFSLFTNSIIKINVKYTQAKNMKKYRQRVTTSSTVSIKIV